MNQYKAKQWVFWITAQILRGTEERSAMFPHEMSERDKVRVRNANEAVIIELERRSGAGARR